MYNLMTIKDVKTYKLYKHNAVIILSYIASRLFTEKNKNRLRYFIMKKKFFYLAIFSSAVKTGVVAKLEK